MKRIVLFFLLSFTFIHQHTEAQQPAGTIKCATDHYLQQVIKKYPTYTKTINASNQLLNSEVTKRIQQRNANRNLSVLATPVTIPVVVHIVLSDPSSVTDSEVQQQIDRLNLDFSGLNPDSNNLAPFPYSLRGHSKMRFVLAKKDPSGNYTTGIERRCSNIKFTGDDIDPIKVTAEGGLDSWDPSSYVNVWVGNSDVSTVLAYATYPFSVNGYSEPPLRYHGITLKRGVFGNATTPYTFNRGRTLVHEMGHYFALFHSFQGGCADNDFNLTSFDAGNTDDTPAQSNATGSGSPSSVSCPSGTVPSGCAASPSGRLFQNYMDYTDDPCMSMFTANQVVRMETSLDFFHQGLKFSDAGNPPAVYGLDVQPLATLSPFAGSAEYLPCNESSTNTYCAEGTDYMISPTLMLRNSGSGVLNNVQVWYSIDGATPVLNKQVTFTVAATSLQTSSITLDPILLTAGTHELKIYTSNPNNIADENPVNDTIKLKMVIDLPLTGPLTEDFENSFPASGWKVVNNGEDSHTWQQTTNAAVSGTASAFIPFFVYDHPGMVDDLVMPPVQITNADTVLLEFERAYMEYDHSVMDFSDTLEILISEDCGSILKSIWKKGGAQLASKAGETGLIDWVPGAGDWAKISMNLRPFLNPLSSTVRVVFRAKNGYGQNLYLDDINLRTVIKTIKDAAVEAIQQPSQRLCSRTFSPALVIKNLGEDTLKSLTVRYEIDGGAAQQVTWTGKLRKFLVDTVHFAPLTVTSDGVHKVRFYVVDPNGETDENTGNDTISHSFFVYSTGTLPLHESFESSVFPPAGWGVFTSDSNYTWKKRPDAASEYVSSTWIKNRVDLDQKLVDELYSPMMKVTNADSLILKFDIAHVTEEYPSGNKLTDTLEVLVTMDCGKTYTSVYKKWGNKLNTLNTAYPGNSTRDTIGFVANHSSQWRTDVVNLTTIVGKSSFQLVFRNTNNNDNNLFLDNIRVNPVILPEKLKSDGYQVLPNPTTGMITVRHYLPPVSLQRVQLVHGSGQLIWQYQYKRNAPVNIPVDLTGQPAGVYFIRLVYDYNIITEKIIKVK